MSKYVVTTPGRARGIQRALRALEGLPRKAVPLDALAARSIPDTYSPGAPGWTEEVFRPRLHPTNPNQAAIPMSAEVLRWVDERDQNGQRIGPRKVVDPQGGPPITVDSSTAVELGADWEAPGGQ